METTVTVEATREVPRYDELVATFRTPNGHPAEMKFRTNTNDWNTLNASMTEDEYHLRGESFEGWAFDIGGYLGSVGIGLALDNPGLRVLIVEPVPDNARLIRENIALNDLDSRVTLIENAAGGPKGEPVSVWYGYRGTDTAEHHAFVGNSSLAYDHGGELQHDEMVYDMPVTLSDLYYDEPVEAVSLVKIDCEGGEWDILTDPAVRFIDRIIGESHAVRGHKGSDIIALLADTHDVTIQGVPEDPEGAGTVEFWAVRR